MKHALPWRGLVLAGCLGAAGLTGCAEEVPMPLKSKPDDALAAARARMVKRQLAARDIRNPRVLEAFARVERHRFVPDGQLAEAYEDYPLPIGHGQTISQPYIVAYMTQALDPKPEDRVLEIGTGSGYQAAILGELCREVYTVEIVPDLGERARRLLADLGYTNVFVRVGDGYKGWPEKAPFDTVIVTCAPEAVPSPLADQVREGGEIVIPVGGRFQQVLVTLRKREGRLEEENRLPVRFVPMVDQSGRRY
jgi:protein-L-isoaspartate(D-aspartate) O-methyltransferase